MVTRERDRPACDLIFKPANGGKGQGIVKFTHQPETQTWVTPEGDVVSPGTVGNWARARLGDESWLVQPFLRNADSWARFTRGALATCRVVTARLVPGGEPFVLGGFARFPLDHEAVDNLSAGGIGMGVDVADGRMTAGTIWVGEVGHHDCHPRTGARITGEVLPGWPEMVALALRAHRPQGSGAQSAGMSPTPKTARCSSRPTSIGWCFSIKRCLRLASLK